MVMTIWTRRTMRNQRRVMKKTKSKSHNERRRGRTRIMKKRYEQDRFNRDRVSQVLPPQPRHCTNCLISLFYF